MSTAFDAEHHPHRRKNPLTGEWVLLSPHLANQHRQSVDSAVENMPESMVSRDHIGDLRPGKKRANGELNPDYDSTFVFDNTSAAFNPDTPESYSDDPLFQCQAEQGCCRIVSYSPDSAKTIAELTQEERISVMHCWQDQTCELSARYAWVQIFENKSVLSESISTHPHCEIWAQNHLPTQAQWKLNNQKAYFATHRRVMLLDYVEKEIEKDERIVCINDDWVVVVPYWAQWPFETLLLPRFPVSSLALLGDAELHTLADIIGGITTRYDNLFNTAFPYSMGWYSAPSDGEAHPEWILHGQFYPSITGTSSKKRVAGYDMFAEMQRDFTPEYAAKQLRKQPELHYKQVK